MAFEIYFLSSGDRGLHRLVVDGFVVHGQEFLFVEDHGLTAGAHDVVHRGEFDGIDGAGFFAHATVNAAEFVEVELGGVFFAVVPGGFGTFDVNAVCRTGGGTHETGDTSHAALLVTVQTMHATEVGLVQTAVFDVHVFATFFGVLHGLGSLAVTEGVFEVAQRRADAFEDFRQVHLLGTGQRLGVHVHNVFITNRHAGLRERVTVRCASKAYCDGL